jgi:hypothetical protein
MRRTIETGLGAPVLDVYGWTEVKEISWQSPARERYHVNAGLAARRGRIR